MTTEESLPGGDDSSPNTPRTGSGAIWFPASEQAAPISTSLTMLPPDPDAEDVALARELGIPDTAPLAQLCVPGEVYARGLSGYVLWVFGIHHPPVPAPTGPFVYVEPPGGGPASAFTIQAWQTWVLTAGSPVIAEVRWHPERGIANSIRGLENTTAQQEVERARRGLAWLLGSGVLRGGRPRGSKKGHQWTRQDFIDWYRETRESYASDGERITLKALGAELGGLSADTAKDRLDDVGLPWPPWSYSDIWNPDPDE